MPEPRTDFRTYLDATERDQLDARAATAEAERDDALNDRDGLRAEINRVEQTRQEQVAHLNRRADTLTRQRDNHASQADRFSAELAKALMAAGEALEARDVLRTRLNDALADLTDAGNEVDQLTADLARVRADVHRDIARQLDILAADPGILRDWLTTCDPQPTGFGELLHALAEKLRRPEAAALGSLPPRAQDEPEREEVRWAYRWIGPDGQVYDEMDASDNAIETAEQRAHRIAAQRLTGTVRGEVIRYRVLTMPAEVVATYPTDRAQDAEPCRGCIACSTEPDCQTEREG